MRNYDSVVDHCAYDFLHCFEADCVSGLQLLERRQYTRIIQNTRKKFALKKKVPVALSFLTSRTPSQDKPGTVVLASLDQSAKSVAMQFDPALLTATMEKIDVTDMGMKMTWGQLYRVLLTSATPVDSGDWTIETV